MTVSSTTLKVTANGNGVATVFSFSPCVIYQSSDLVVTKTDAFGAETTLTEGTGSTNYSVSVTSYPGTGSITYPAVGGTPLATGEKITMKPVLPQTQASHLQNQGGYFPSTVETALDKLTYMIQELQEEVDRSVKVSISSTTDPDMLIDEINTSVSNAAASAAASASSASSSATQASNAAASAAAAAASAASIATPIPVASGGTGATTAAGARTNLGISNSESFIATLTPDTGVVTVQNPARTYRYPYAFTITSVKADLVTAQTSGSVITIDIKKNGTSIFSTLLTFDNTEDTTTTAATAAVLSTTSIAANDKITFHVTQVGDGTAKGLKVTIIGHQ